MQWQNMASCKEERVVQEVKQAITSHVTAISVKSVMLRKCMYCFIEYKLDETYCILSKLLILLQRLDVTKYKYSTISLK